MYEQAWRHDVPIDWLSSEFQNQWGRFKADHEVEDTRMPFIDRIPGTNIERKERIVYPGNLGE